ncbi:MAG: MFS transporter [Candidatus Obscuribacterales bacterium]
MASHRDDVVPQDAISVERAEPDAEASRAHAEASCARAEPAAPELGTRDIILILLIAGFGFLVDVYDSVLFAVVRVSTLTGLGVPQSQELATTVTLFNTQMTGMILGGLLWGMLGDKKGRRAALFGSIILYSLANIATAFVNDVSLFGVLRFLSGIGLAGEVGAAMTVAAEITPRKYRSYGTAFVSTLGVLGSILASTVAGGLPWRTAFLTAGAAGFLLLLARFSMKEPPIFAKIVKESGITRGNVKLLLTKTRAFRLLRCVVAAVPLFFVFGILVSFAPEVWNLKASQTLHSVAAIAFFYTVGETFGELISGALSQLLRSRKKVMLSFLAGGALCTFAALNVPASMYGVMLLPAGFFVGYWSVIMTTTAEQFGTNIRSTAATLVPNLMRATVIPLNFLFGALTQHMDGHVTAMILGAVCMSLAGIAIWTMEETFNKNLDFVET